MCAFPTSIVCKPFAMTFVIPLVALQLQQKSNSDLVDSSLSLSLIRNNTSLDISLEGEPVSVVDYGHPSWLTNCTSIYLDVGSNIGVQVRKLLEPEKYPDAPVLPLFDESFGSPLQRRELTSRGKLCALGFEPNPQRLPRLQAIEKAYSSRGWHVHFYPFAAWKEESVLEFDLSDVSPDPNIGWGTRVMLKKNSTKVRAVDFAEFVGTLPTGSVRLMKMDIEGAEYETTAHLLTERKLCGNIIKKAFIEAHPWGDTTTWAANRGYTAIRQKVEDQPWCGNAAKSTVYINKDDETYFADVDTRFGQEPFDSNKTLLEELRASCVPWIPYGCMAVPKEQLSPWQKVLYEVSEYFQDVYHEIQCVTST